jgi:hypothetical protein
MYAAKLHLSGLTGTAKQPDMQKTLIIGFFFENRLRWQFEVAKEFLQAAILGYIFIYVQIKHKYITLYVYLTSGGKQLSHKQMQHNYITKMFTRRDKPIRIIGDPDN